MAVSEQDIRHVMALARLDVPAGRLPQLVAQLNGILAHMDVLSQVKTDGVEVAIGVGAASMPLRVDHGPPVPLRREPEAFAPRMRDGFFLVPRLASHAALGRSADADDATDATDAAEGDA